MKMKINRASDLSSISVLPPHSRISKSGHGGRESSVYHTRQTSQLRAQQSQQSSQLGGFSQLSQNSLDETLTNEQRFGSQEPESSSRRMSCLPLINYTREESKVQLSRPSTGLIRKWNSAGPDNRCKHDSEQNLQSMLLQTNDSAIPSDEFEHRIGMIETALSRFGILLDSVQSDVMQANKGTKEVLLEIERLRQKLLLTDDSHQLMNKIQEDLKASLDAGLNLISSQLGQNEYRENLQNISPLISQLPDRIEALIVNSHTDLCRTFTAEMQKMACSLKATNQTNPSPTAFPPKAPSFHAQPQDMPSQRNPAKARQVTFAPKVEMGSWNNVKRENSNSGPKQTQVSPVDLERESRVIIESDEDLDCGFSCLLKEKETETDIYSKEAKEESMRILRKARRRKRKLPNIIIIN